MNTNEGANRDALKARIAAQQMTEPRITIGGVELSYAEAMTLRCAVHAFAVTLQAEGLGDDKHGRAKTENYLFHLRQISLLMFASTKKDGIRPPL